MVDMLIIQHKVILDIDFIGEVLFAGPNGFNELGLVVRDGLVEINLLEGGSLRSLVTGGRDGDVLIKLDSLTLGWSSDLETEAALKVLGAIELDVIQRFGVVAHASSILVDTRGDTESMRGFKTIGAMHAIKIVGDPNTGYR